jgi:hypothetical protein
MDLSSSLVPARCGGLVGKVQSGDCVLVLGPRIAMPAEIDPKQTPIDEYLALRLLADLGNDDQRALGLREAMSRYEQRIGEPALRSLVQQVAADLDERTTELHRDLASLPFRLVLQTTPDRMMFEAFRAVGKTGAVEAYYNYCPEVRQDGLLAAPSADKPIVYSLFGRQDHPESMVLTDQNLLDYLVTLTRERPPLPDSVRATLRARSTLFLFVGFGFASWWLRLLLKVLDITGVANRGLSLALEDKRSFDAASLEDRGFFEKSIYIQSGDWNALVKDLAKRYRELPSRKAATLQAAPASPSGKRPLVFLSYASEDGELVDRLRIALDAQGLAVWQDSQNLRAGQNWEAKIEEFIKRVDYFVFVQTENMDKRDNERRDGVYNRELKLALKRAEDKPHGAVFVIHATVGRCMPRREPELSAVHRAKLDTDAGIASLATAILEAFALPSEGVRDGTLEPAS